MSEQGTPGHGGKMCADPAYWCVLTLVWNGDLIPVASRKWAIVDAAGRHLLAVANCPACGTRLVPDEVPLPVPEGCDKVYSEPGTSTLAQNVAWRVFSRLTNGNCSFVLYGLDQASTESAWRRAFGGKEDK
jgi:hypothetical protein